MSHQIKILLERERKAANNLTAVAINNKNERRVAFWAGFTQALDLAIRMLEDQAKLDEAGEVNQVT